jgi:hypothetical protein
MAGLDYSSIQSHTEQNGAHYCPFASYANAYVLYSRFPILAPRLASLGKSR